MKSAYGVPGDRLWVREVWSWRSGNILDDKAHEKYAIYAADHPNDCGKYKSPMFMPRWASRITLELTAVRVERVQEISEADAKAEGIAWNFDLDPFAGEHVACRYQSAVHQRRGWDTARAAYEELWNTLNAKRGFPWSSNPWCWVLEFKKGEVSA